MQDVLIKLDSALQDVQRLIETNQQKQRELEQREKDLESHTYAHKERKTILDNREQNIAHVENIVLLKQEAEKLMEEAQKKLVDLKDKESRFNNAVAIQTAELNGKREEMNREEANLEKNKKHYDKEVANRLNEILKNMGMKIPVETPVEHKEPEDNGGV